MASLHVCTFAVGFPDGPRSSTFDVTLSDAGAELRVGARTQVSRSEVVVRPSPDAAPTGAGAPLTREGVREAVFDGAWLGKATFAPSWPGQRIGPDTWRQLTLYLSGSSLRKFAAPAGEPEPSWIAPPAGLGQVVVSFLIGANDGPPKPADGADDPVLGHAALAGGRTLWVTARREAFISELQKAGFFTALRKRGPPGITQAAAWLDGTRVLFACEIDGAGLLVEQPGDLFRTRANY